MVYSKKIKSDDGVDIVITENWYNHFSSSASEPEDLCITASTGVDNITVSISTCIADASYSSDINIKRRKAAIEEALSRLVTDDHCKSILSIKV